MYLKKIVAQGFKSFADKITIDLTDGITGIVGPNGSGKSNVVDAIRWVLGEQSVKSLRGDGNMTDVIFSGSKSRSASNVASVMLIFDNSDNYINLNYSEISIKRRVYRDGTNEYYLNNEQCRLKDITNILLDSGMAKESFNIISQGQIDEIILSKPADRRVMIEEAAGVLKYKRRKEDALKKIDKTNDNINRVNDIINELERQVEPLKVEKERALKYISVKEELEEIEVALIASDITNLNYKYQDGKARIQEVKKEILNISTINSTNESKLMEFKNKQSKVDDAIKVNHAKLLELTEMVEKLNSQKKIILERQKYKVDDSKLHDNLVSLKERELKLETDIKVIEVEINNVSSNLENTYKKFDDKQKEIEKLKKEKNVFHDKLSVVVRDNISLRQRVDSLRESIDNNNSLPLAVRSVLNNPKLRGIHDVIGSLIEVTSKYSKAITNILGASANNIVVDDEKSAKDAIFYLKENNLGRATFFPLSVIKPKSISKDDLYILEDEGCVGVASDLVSFDVKYKNIILNQLGNILVVYDIDSANRISKKLNYRYRVVTLDGEVIHVGGSITGGNQAKTTNVISLKYELEDGVQELSKQENLISSIEESLNEIDDKLKFLEDELYLISKDKITENEVLNNKNKVLSSYQLELEEVQNDLIGTNNILEGKLSEEEELILKQYYNSLREKEEISANLIKLEGDKHDVQELKEQFEYQLRKENSNFNNKNKELRDLEIYVNRLDVKLDTLLNNLRESYNMTYERAISLYKLELDEELARNKVASLKRELKEIGDVNLNAPASYDAISERYEFLISQREDLVGACNTLMDIIKEMDGVMIREFSKTFEVVNANFSETFRELFKGGNASLKLTVPDNLLETGIEIIASPPGKKLKNISLLSGGEKTFTAISLLFAILKSRPVPFCVLDEVEAALDEVNVDSFGNYVKKLKEKTQFIIITHKKKTMEYANVLYGITMQESGVSKLVSVRLEDALKEQTP